MTVRPDPLTGASLSRRRRRKLSASAHFDLRDESNSGDVSENDPVELGRIERGRERPGPTGLVALTGAH